MNIFIENSSIRFHFVSDELAACSFKRDWSRKVLVVASVVDIKPPLTGYQKVNGSDEAAATVVITSGSDNSRTPTHCSYSLHHGSTSQYSS